MLVKEFTRVAKYYIFIVPNKAYRLRPLGNEDLLTKGQWEQILNEFNIMESNDIYKTWSNNKFRRVFEVICFFFNYDLRENQMYYAKVAAK